MGNSKDNQCGLNLFLLQINVQIIFMIRMFAVCSINYQNMVKKTDYQKIFKFKKLELRDYHSSF